MNLEELNEAMNILEFAIDKGMLDKPKNDEKLKKLLTSISKVKKLNKLNKHKLATVADIIHSASNMTASTTASATASTTTSTLTNTDTSEKKHKFGNKTLKHNLTSSESASESNSSNSYYSELISMTNNQPPSDMFICDESDITMTHQNLAIPEHNRISDDEDSDQIIILK